MDDNPIKKIKIIHLQHFFLIPRSRDFQIANPKISGLKIEPESRDSGSRDCNSQYPLAISTYNIYLPYVCRVWVCVSVFVGGFILTIKKAQSIIKSVQGNFRATLISADYFKLNRRSQTMCDLNWKHLLVLLLDFRTSFNLTQ